MARSGALGTTLALGLHSFLVLAVLTTACDGDTGPREVAVTIPFSVVVGDAPFECGEAYPDLGSAATEMGFSDMRMYLYDVVLHTEEATEHPVILSEDGIWQRDGVALLDFEDGCENGTAQTNTTLVGTTMSGDYTGISFSVGVPPALNSSETVLEGRGSPLNQVAMFWSWQSGYKYIRLDGNAGPFRLHLGASGCSDDFTCTEMNIPRVTLGDFHPETHTVQLDIGDLIAGTNIAENAEGTAPGCMGESIDPDCTDIFTRIGLNGMEEQTAWSAQPIIQGAAQ